MSGNSSTLSVSGESPEKSSNASKQPSQVHLEVESRTKTQAKHLPEDEAYDNHTRFLKEELGTYREQKQDALENGACKARIRWFNQEIERLEDKLEDRTPPDEASEKQLVEVTR